MATLAEIEAKIHEHREQLAQVNELLALSPTDAALLSLAADINAVLTVAYEERRIAKGEVRPGATTTAAVGFVPAAAAASSAAPPPLPAPAAAAAALAAAMSASAGVPPPPPPPLPPALPSSSSDAAAAAAGAAGAAGVTGAAPGGRKWQVKERCMAQWTDGKYYVARVDGGTDLHTYRVTYLDFGDSAEVMSSQLLPYLPAPAALLKPGVLVRAVWPEDGLFYDAKVEGLGSAMGLFLVKFTKYKKAASEVPVNDIVLRRITPTVFNPSDAKDAAAAFAPEAEASSQTQAFAATGGLTEEEVRHQLALRVAPEFAASTAASAAAAAASGAAAGATGAAALAALKAQRAAALAVDLGEKASIPEELQILPTDSEQIRQMKLKKIKRLKNRHRRAVLEQAGEKKQSSWQQFTARAERVAGSAVAVAGAAGATGATVAVGAAAGAAAAAGVGRAATAAAPGRAAAAVGALKPQGAAEKAIAKNKTALEALKVLGRKRKSIFASPDTIDGRVGVTGSGRPMTAYTDLAAAKLAKTAATPAPLPHDDA